MRIASLKKTQPQSGKNQVAVDDGAPVKEESGKRDGCQRGYSDDDGNCGARGQQSPAAGKEGQTSDKDEEDRVGGEGNGEAPVKVCDNCGELVHISVMACPACGHAFPEPEKKKLELRNDDIMGLEGKDLDVTAWNWRIHTSRASGKMMLACTYYGSLSDKPITEYLPVLHDGYAGQRAMQQLFSMANSGAIPPKWAP